MPTPHTDRPSRKSISFPAWVPDIVGVNAIETTGVVDAQRQLRLDEPLPISGPSRVRVIILVPEAGDIEEHTWTKAAAGQSGVWFPARFGGGRLQNHRRQTVP